MTVTTCRNGWGELYQWRSAAPSVAVLVVIPGLAERKRIDPMFGRGRELWRERKEGAGFVDGFYGWTAVPHRRCRDCEVVMDSERAEICWAKGRKSLALVLDVKYNARYTNSGVGHRRGENAVHCSGTG